MPQGRVGCVGGLGRGFQAIPKSPISAACLDHRLGVVPVSAIRPSSRTTIWSASTIVCNRCAITRTVRSLASLLNDCCTKVFRFGVGRGSRLVEHQDRCVPAEARAIVRRCRSPPTARRRDRGTCRSRRASVRSGHRCWPHVPAASIRSREASGTAGRCSQRPCLPRVGCSAGRNRVSVQLVAVHRPDVATGDSDSARADVVKRANSAASVDLPDPTGPTSAVTVPVSGAAEMSCSTGVSLRYRSRRSGTPHRHRHQTPERPEGP